MLGAAHRVAVRGVALSEALAFETPLGRIALDQGAMLRVQAWRKLEELGALAAVSTPVAFDRIALRHGALNSGR
jgi:hypothetical protein